MTPRTIYVDPGTAWTAWAICEPASQGEPLPLRVVDHGEIETGHLVPLPPSKVKTYTRADGSEGRTDKKREVSPEDRQRVAADLVRIAQYHGVKRSVIERIGHVFLGGGDAAKTKQAEGARQTSMVEEIVCVRLADAGIAIVSVARYTWANRLRVFLPQKIVGAPSMTRAELLPILQVGFDGCFPVGASKSEHERDCGGMALWDALPVLESKRAARAASSGARAPRVKREKRSAPRGDRVRGKMGPIDLEKYRATARAYYARTEGAARAAARAAAGCDCREAGKPRRGRCRVTCASRPPVVAPPGYRGIRATGLR